MLLLLHARAYGDISVYIVGMSLLSCRYVTLAHSYCHASVPTSTLQFWSYTYANLSKEQICPMFIRREIDDNTRWSIWKKVHQKEEQRTLIAIYSYILLARKSRVYYFKNRFCNTFQPMRKSYLNCIANMLFNDIHVQFINMSLKYFVSIGT